MIVPSKGEVVFLAIKALVETVNTDCKDMAWNRDVIYHLSRAYLAIERSWLNGTWRQGEEEYLTQLNLKLGGENVVPHKPTSDS